MNLDDIASEDLSEARACLEGALFDALTNLAGCANNDCASERKADPSETQAPYWAAVWKRGAELHLSQREWSSAGFFGCFLDTPRAFSD